ncbi:chromatin modification- protein VID21 [Puccinia graminis f. sp. tritici]|uniref:Chromatin modification-protein VID21 n=2 Tax=Puccinia graminis f. sp. tritici TaxID=56615 RepID=A0A5B0MY73_PUCGR|nr:chromatin modification- protein VID21 [Puccinia graminis f. sp. tritici]KAA1131190.1 chromatin modification- protein VID21 [Puccinia graminis f. sp. tritici]
MQQDRLDTATTNLRERAIQDRQQLITESQEIYHRLLSEVSWAIQSIRQLGELGGGLAPPTQHPISSEQEARLREFVEKITTGRQSPHDIDLAHLQDDNPPEQAKQVDTEAEVARRESDAMDLDVIVESQQPDKTSELTAVSTQVDHSEPTNLNPGHVDAQRSLRQKSTESLSIPQPQSALSARPGPSHKSRTESENILSASAKCTVSRQSPSASNRQGPTNQPTITRASSLPSDSSAQSHKASRFTSLDYVSQLPSVPVQILASRLSAAQAVTGTTSKNIRRQAIRSGLWIGPGSSEITKLGIKAQHIGVKSALRKGSPTKSKNPYEKSKLHNVLTTADWKTMVDELQMARALEVLERLKAEKAWAYSQIKKPRIAPVQKAHWDHLLDEMTWLQIDFRQERRWKIVTAHRLAKQVLQWHQADSLGKQRLQVKVHSPRKHNSAGIENLGDCASSSLAPPHQIGPSSNTRPIDLTRLSSEVAHGDASPSLSTKGSPESLRPIHPLRSPISAEAASISAVEKLTATTTPEASHTSHDSRKTLQQIKRSRIPIFEMAPDETLIDAEKLVLDGIRAKPVGYTIEHVKLQKLFADLPLFGDLDSRPDKRPDEASPHLGRIARVAPFLEAKPLLVSTLQPSKNCLGMQWRNLGPLSADDLRESGEHKSDSSHHPSYIFSGRKSKEIKESNIPAPPASPAPDFGRSDELNWVSSDEELLKQIASTYEFNWKIVADVFNASLSQSMNIPVTSRDCYDCWTRLHQAPKSATHDTSTSLSKSNHEPNPSTAAVPAPTLQSNAELPSTEPNEQTLTDEPLCTNASKRPAQASLFPNKRTARDDALQEIARKVKEKRSTGFPRPAPSPTQSRQIVLSAHETHAQTLRPYMTPLEMSALKAERDRQTQAALEMAKRQQQMHHESLLHQARAAAVVAAAAQIPLRNTTNKVSGSVNGNGPSRVTSQPTAVNFAQARHNGLPAVNIHRQTAQVPARYATSPPLINVSNRGTASPVPHPPATSLQARQSLLENQAASAAPVGSQAPIVPQLPNMPQGFQPKTPNSQSPAPGSTPGHHTPNGTTQTPNGLHNNTVSHSLTPIQVAQYLQQQQHLQLQRSPEHRIHHQHQQLLLAQHFQQQSQHAPPPFGHQASPQVFAAHQSPPHLQQNPPISNGQSQLSSGATSAANSTPPLAASSSPLPHPPA